MTRFTTPRWTALHCLLAAAFFIDEAEKNAAVSLLGMAAQRRDVLYLMYRFVALCSCGYLLLEIVPSLNTIQRERPITTTILPLEPMPMRDCCNTPSVAFCI